MSGKRSARGGAKQAELLAAQQAPEGLDDAELALSSDEEYESGEEEGSELGLSGSGSDADDSEEEDEGRPRSSGVDREIENAALAYMAAVQKRQQRQQAGGSGRCERGGCRRRWGPYERARCLLPTTISAAVPHPLYCSRLLQRQRRGRRRGG